MNIEIIHGADYHIKNREKNVYKSIESNLANIRDILISTKAEVYLLAGDLFDVAISNESERKLASKHIGEILNIETLKEFVFINGNHDILVDKKKLDSNKVNNSFDTLNKFIETLSPELSKKITYLKEQKPYVSKVSDKLLWIPYSLENGLSNGNNFQWNLLSQDDNNKCQITIFHDIVRDYIDDTKLPVRKDKLETLPFINDFKTNIILSGDIHKNYFKTVNGKLFVYPGSSNQVSFGEGTYIKIRKNSSIVHADEKVLKHHKINLDNNSIVTNDISLNNYITYITIDLNSNRYVNNVLEDIEKLLNISKFGINQTMVKLKLSSVYVKHEIEIYKLIETICLSKNTIFNISTVYDKFVISSDGTNENLDLQEIQEDEELTNEINIDELKLSIESLNKIFSTITNNYRSTLMKETNDEDLVNGIIENIQTLFSEQIELSLSAIPNFKIKLDSVETTGFMGLGPNKINLDIPGLVKINGANGIGKTTLYNLIRFIIKGIVFDNLLLSRKKQNTLLIFNDKLINNDVITQRLNAHINNTQIAITRSAFRKWKNNVSDEMKSSLNWKDYISEVSTTIKLDVMTKDGQKTFTGEEAEAMILKWFGDIASTILILNQQKILTILNSPSDKLQKMVLDYIGIDYLEILRENLPSIKNQYNLVKPKTNFEDLKIELSTQNKIKFDGDESLIELKKKIDSNKIDIDTIKLNIENKNKELINIGNVPTSINELKESLTSNENKINSFNPKLLIEIPIFDKIKPVKEDLSNIDSKLIELKKQLELDTNKKISLNNDITNDSNKLLELLKLEKSEYPNKLNKGFENLSQSISNEIQLLTESKSSIFGKLNLGFNDTLIALKEKQKDKLSEVNSITNDINQIINRNNTIDDEIKSGVCEKCERPFGNDFESHKESLIKEKEDNNHKNIGLNNTLITEKELLTKIDNFIILYQSYYDKSIVENLEYFITLSNIKDEPFQHDILNCNLINDSILKLTELNNKVLIKDIDYIDIFSKNNIKINELFSLESFINETLIIKNKLDSIDLFIENLLKQNIEYNYTFCLTEINSIINNIKLLKLLEVNITSLTSNITTLNNHIIKVNTDYNVNFETYNNDYQIHQNKVNEINTLNEEITTHNLSISNLREKSAELKLSILKQENNLPTYNSLIKQIDDLKTFLKVEEENNTEIVNSKNELEKNLLNVDNKLNQINIELTDWLEYRRNNHIYSIYEKLINKDFPDVIFEYYRKFLNNTLNILLEDLSFKLYWDKNKDLYMIELGNGMTTYRPVQLTSGMQTCFLGLSLIYSLHLLNVKNDISHLFIDELSGALNTGKELKEIDNQTIVNYQEQLTLLLSKFKTKNIFIIDHNIENLFQTATYEVILNEKKLAEYVIVDN